MTHSQRLLARQAARLLEETDGLVLTSPLVILTEAYAEDDQTGSKPGTPQRRAVCGDVQPVESLKRALPELADGLPLEGAAFVATLRYADLPDADARGFELEWQGRVYAPTQRPIRWDSRYWFIPLATPR